MFEEDKWVDYFSVNQYRVGSDLEEIEECVRSHYLNEAIISIETHGRYWHGSISRTAAKVLVDLLCYKGINVIAHELPPEWEFVFDGKVHDLEDLKRVATERTVLRKKGFEESQLPK
jgi:hypothetical protein